MCRSLQGRPVAPKDPRPTAPEADLLRVPELLHLVQQDRQPVVHHHRVRRPMVMALEVLCRVRVDPPCRLLVHLILTQFRGCWTKTLRWSRPFPSIRMWANIVKQFSTSGVYTEISCTWLPSLMRIKIYRIYYRYGFFFKRLLSLRAEYFWNL